MKRATRLAAIGALLAAPLAMLPVLAAGNAPVQSIGINAAIRNIVQIKIITEAAMRRAVLREPIHIGDVVASGPNSAMQVLLKDQSVFTVGANARMTIDRFVYDPDRGTGSLAASVARGAFRFMSGKAAHGGAGQVAIKTPIASIGVRGTIVEVLVGDEALAMLQTLPAPQAKMICPDAQPGDAALKGKVSCADAATATLIVLRGPGPKRIGNDRVGAIDITADGKTLPVTRTGFVVVGGPGQPPIGPFPLPPQLSAFLDQTLSTTPASQDRREEAARIEKSVKFAVDRPDPNAALALARVVLDERSSPAALQVALANAAADFKPGSRTFDLLMQMSFLVMKSTNEPSVAVIDHELATDRGDPVLSGFSDRHPVDLSDAVTKVIVYRTASSDMPIKWAKRTPSGDTILAGDVVPVIREVPQGSPF